MKKKDAYYFSHDCNAQDDPKCMMLIDDLGMEGYGIFWALIEKLRAEKDYVLPFSICGRFARRWATSEAKIQAVVNNYGLFEIVDGVFFSLRLKRSMEEKSAKARISAEARWGKSQQLTSQNQCERIPIAYERNAEDMRSNAIKEKETKEKGNGNTMADKPADEAFEKFWDYYGKKGNKQKSLTMWKKLTEKNKGEIRANIKTYIESTPELKYRKNAEVYLNPKNEHWNDEAIAGSSGDAGVNRGAVTKVPTGVFA